MKSRKPSRTNTQKDILFIIGDQNAKVGSQEITGKTGKFGLEVENEAGLRLIEFCQKNKVCFVLFCFAKVLVCYW